MSRIDNIKNYKARTEEAKVNKMKTEEIEREELANAMLGLADRVAELIETANACLENGIEISHPNPYSATKHPLDFTADGWEHTIGFNSVMHQNHVTDIRICAGGACGKFGIITNGYEVYDLHEEQHYYPFDRITKHKPTSIRFMKRFINEFDEFEQRFYDYVDRVTNS